MEYLNDINLILQKMITGNTYKVVTLISFDGIERGFNLIGDYFDNNDNFIGYASYNNAFDLRNPISEMVQ
ncbi:MAG: hypothetical protein U5M51_02425 [Emticicia sp.]|nr:hypothetical protein [Emticicia sp.]